MTSRALALAALVSLAPVCAAAQMDAKPSALVRREPTWWVLAAGEVGQPVQEFADYVDVGGGMLLGVVHRPHGWPVGIRMHGQFLLYGYNSRTVSPFPLVTVDITTNNFITGLTVGPQIQAGSGSAQLYGFGAAGFSYFATTTTASGTNGLSGSNSTTNYDEFALALEAGGGVLLHLAGRTSLDLGARYLYHGEVSYVTEDGVEVTPDGIFATPVRSRANLVVWHLGVSIVLGKR